MLDFACHRAVDSARLVQGKTRLPGLGAVQDFMGCASQRIALNVVGNRPHCANPQSPARTGPSLLPP
jgi:hypothetical protein